jgi:glycosyltransferase involved in cell wall biosynthesis
MAKQHDYNIKALIIGHEMTSGYRDILKKQADDLDISNQITFQDFTQQPQQLMQLCDCIVLATRYETFGLVLPEAMRSGVAVIGSNSGGVPEIIQHDKTGLLFESFNAQDLFKQIERIYLDVDLKNQLAAQGKQDADIRFNDTLHFQQLEKLFRSCIN